MGTRKKNENKNLFRMVMKGQWGEVEERCKENLDLLKQKITKTGATALHVAVTENQLHAVGGLVKLIVAEDKKEALRAQTDEGDTPLHLAASMGSEVVCRCMLKADPTLIGCQNSNGETPLFMAALYGKTSVFRYFHTVYSIHDGYFYSRRNDGNTILHCAIAGEFMDLAYLIIRLYGQKLVDSVNEKGHTALHVLASKPAAFPSGNKLGLFNKIIYGFLSAELELEVKKNDKIDGEVPIQFKSPKTEETVDVEKHETISDDLAVVHGQSVELHNSRDTSVELKSTANIQEEETADIEKQGTTSNNKGVPSEESSRSLANISVFYDFIGLCTESTLDLIEAVTPYKRIKKYIEGIREIKKKNQWSVEIMNQLLQLASIYEYVDPAGPWNLEQEHEKDEDNPYFNIYQRVAEEEKQKHTEEEKQKIEPPKRESNESAILIAAKNGIKEIVKCILREYPVAINDRDASRKNIVILAAENRHLNLFNFLMKKNYLREGIVRQRDDKGNNVLHATAVYNKLKPWPIPGAAAQMQWEIKWFQYVKSSMPKDITFPRNNKEESPEEIFTETHGSLVKEGADWLVRTSESCSVVAALISAVAFATSSSVPGGLDEATGKPKLEKLPAFQVFSISSLVALCFSVTSLTMFLAILTSRFQETNFNRDLPVKLLVGMTSLFVSIASILVSFSSGHSLMTEDKFRYALFPVYAVACLPVSIFAVAQFPLYLDLLRTNFKSRFDFSPLNFDFCRFNFDFCPLNLFNHLIKPKQGTSPTQSSSASTEKHGEQKKL